MIVLPSIGVLPFFIPLAHNERPCNGTLANSSASAGGRVSELPCADVDAWPFAVVTSLWWISTSLFLFEFMRIAFGKRQGFGALWHHAFTWVFSSATYALLEAKGDDMFGIQASGQGSADDSASKLWLHAMIKILISGWPHYCLLLGFTVKPFLISRRAAKAAAKIEEEAAARAKIKVCAVYCGCALTCLHR